ncbi:hypothetical protein VKS41_008058 [Umbelopsis sp. WA50703]
MLKSSLLVAAPVRRFTTSAYLRSAGNPHSKIHGLPFKLSEDKAKSLINLTAYVNEHTFASIFKILGSVITRKKPNVTNQAQDLELRQVYLPFWYFDAAVSATCTLKKSATQEKAVKNEVLGMAFDTYWPGFEFDPLHYVSLGKPHNQDIQDAVPFTPKLYEGRDNVEVFPFTVNPLSDVVDRSQLVNDFEFSDERSLEYSLDDVKVEFSAAYPLYWPVYIAKFTIGHDEKKEERTIVLAAHKDDPFFLQWEPTLDGPGQWLNNGTWLNADVTEPYLKPPGQRNSLLKASEKYYTNNVIGQFGAGGENIDWEDKRIQSYPVYHRDNKDYLTEMFKVWAHKSMLHMLKTRKESMASGLKEGEMELLPHETLMDNTRKELATAEEKMKAAEPAWLKE